MKKLLGYLVLIVVVLIGMAPAMTSAHEVTSAHKHLVVSLENGNLVVEEVKMVVPHVPAGLSAEIAYQLATGELKEFTIKAEKGDKTYKFSHPLKKKTVFSDTIMAYENGQWTRKTVFRIEEVFDWPLTVFFLWIPALGILLISLENRLSGFGHRKLLVFYVSMLAGGSAGVFAGIFTGGLVGGLTGVLVGVLVGRFSGEFAGELVGKFAGAFAGVSIGSFAGAFAGIGNYEIIIYYFVFLFSVEILSFIIALTAASVKKHLPVIKRWVEA